MKSRLSAVFTLLIFLSYIAHAQYKPEDSVFLQEAVAHSLKIYNDRLADQSPLYNGSQYIKPENQFKEGSPYFLTNGFTGNSSVCYDQIQFDSLDLLYEDLRQRLVLKSRTYQLQLVNPRISAFSVAGHRFIRLLADTLHPGINETGFYEVLYQGSCALLKWTSKEIDEQLSINEGVVKSIKTNIKYLIKKTNRYYRVKSKHDLLDVFKDRQTELERFIKKNHLKYHADPENMLIQTVRYYDSIRH